MKMSRNQRHLAAIARSKHPRDELRTVGGWATLFLVALIVLSVPCKAQQGGATQTTSHPRFEIETIVVENQRKFPPEIIVAASHLQEGRAYSEDELRDARYRIMRLPLVLEADFELRKGSERGKYELVIQVTEARRWFFGIDNRVTRWSQAISVDGLSSDSITLSELSLAGYRLPVGGEGLFFVTIGGADGTLSLGYTNYNLLSRNVIMSLKVSWADCADVRSDSSSNELGEDGCATEIFDLGLDPTYSSWTLNGNNYRGRFNLSIPIRGNQSVRFLSSYRFVKNGVRRPAYRPEPQFLSIWDDRSDLDTGLAWVYNSEDDSILPTRGRFLEAGLAYRWLEADLFGFFSDSADSEPFDSKEIRAQVSAKQHWPVRPKITLSLGVQAHLGRSRVRDLPIETDDLPADDRPIVETMGLVRVSDDLTTFGASATFEHALFLKRVINGAPKHPARRPRWREWRWENRLTVFYSGTDPSFDQPDNPVGGLRLGSGVVFRNTWGIFRFELAYTNAEGR